MLIYEDYKDTLEQVLMTYIERSEMYLHVFYIAGECPKTHTGHCTTSQDMRCAI